MFEALTHGFQAASLPDNTSYNEVTNTFNYNLNLDKQRDNFINDADIDDLTIEVNDSNKNINLKCNAGFYKYVGFSVLSSLSLNFTVRINDIQVKCVEFTQNLDQGGLQANLVLKFQLTKVTDLWMCYCSLPQHQEKDPGPGRRHNALQPDISHLVLSVLPPAQVPAGWSGTEVQH